MFIGKESDYVSELKFIYFITGNILKYFGENKSSLRFLYFDVDQMYLLFC